MFRMLAKLFRKEEVPPEPFVDPALGQFSFERGLGWKRQIVLGDTQIELVFGSDGEPPADKMLQMGKSWIEEWPSQSPKIIAYIRDELRKWTGEPDLPKPENFEVESINILWREEPETSMIYFHHPGDDIRAWHVTFHRFEPQGFAYDD